MFRRIFFSFLIFFSLLAPNITLAVSKVPQLIGGELLPGTGSGGVPNVSSESLKWFQETFFRNTIDILIGLVASLAVLFLIIGGYQYLTAAGNEEQLKQAHKTILWSIGGILIAIFAFAAVQIVIGIDFGEAAGNLLAAELPPDILPFGESGWNEVKEIGSLPDGKFKEEFLPKVAKFLIYGMSFIAFIMFFAAGAWMVFGWGEEEQIKKAKQIIIWGVTGLAYAAAAFIVVKGLLSVNWGW